MKKKLLLSSVAALTLFAAYNVATADESTNTAYNLLAEKPFDLLSVVKDAEKFEKVDALEVSRLAALVKQRQAVVNALRDANQEVKDAEQEVVDSEKAYNDAYAELQKAVADLQDAENKAKDAKLLKEKLEAVKEQNLLKLKEDKDERATVKSELDQLVKDQKAAATQLAGAEAENKAHAAKSPVAGSSKDVVAEYESKKITLGHNVDVLKRAKSVLDRKVDAKSKKLAQLDKDIAAEVDRDEALDLAIKKLAKFAGSLEEFNNLEVDENTDERNLTPAQALLKELKGKIELAKAKLSDATDRKLVAQTNVKNAKVNFEEKVAKAKEEFARQNVAFNLDELLKSDAPSTEGFVKFGWSQNEKGEWNFLVDSNSTKATGWKQIEGKWYFFNAEGVMQKWWVKDGNTWYYLNGSGEMQTGWLNDNGTWYYLEASGAMKANQWFEVDGKWYHVTESGALSVNTTVDGYNVNENGEWV